MKTVHKTQLPFQEGQYSIRMPEDFEILHLGDQSGYPTIWYLCDYNGRTAKEVQFSINWTGQPLVGVESMTFLGTVVCAEGSLVLHIWMKK